MHSAPPTTKLRGRLPPKERHPPCCSETMLATATTKTTDAIPAMGQHQGGNATVGAKTTHTCLRTNSSSGKLKTFRISSISAVTYSTFSSGSSGSGSSRNEVSDGFSIENSGTQLRTAPHFGTKVSFAVYMQARLLLFRVFGSTRPAPPEQIRTRCN